MVLPLMKFTFGGGTAREAEPSPSMAAGALGVLLEKHHGQCRLADRLRDVFLSLGGKCSLSQIAMTFALSVLLVRVLDRDLLIHQILAIQIGNRVI